MATLVKTDNRQRPWAAKRTRHPFHYFLGYYETKEEAEAVEKAFDARRPSNRSWWNRRGGLAK